MEFQIETTEFFTAASIALMMVSLAVPFSYLAARTALGRYHRRRVSSPHVQGRGHEKRRGQKRLRTCLLGSLHTGNPARVDNICDVIDFSSSGARIRLVDPMAETAHIILGLRHFGFFPARVAWRNGEELGLQFETSPETVARQMRGLLPEPAVAGAF